MRRIILSILVLTSAPLGAKEAGFASLEKLLAQVEASNPEIRAARAAWSAAEGRVGPAGAWPEPVLLFSKEKTPAGEKMSHLKAEQDIPFPGKLSKEKLMARRESRIAEARWRAAALKARADARVYYYEIFRADRRIALLRENVGTLKTILKSMETRLSSGRGGAMGGAVQGSDVFTMWAELGRMENMLFEEEQARRISEFGLNTLLDRSVYEPVGGARAPELRDLGADLPAILNLARENNPLYLSAMHEENHARAMLVRSRLSLAPDFGVMYDRQRDQGGMTGHEAGVSLKIPLWLTRPLGDMKEARAHLEEAEAAAAAMRNDVKKMAAMEFTEVHTHLALARRLRDEIVPASKSAFRLSRRRFESGGEDFVRFLETFRALLDAQREYDDEIYHYGEHWGRLEQWVGAALPAKE